jgi:hydrogenase-4 component E
VSRATYADLLNILAGTALVAAVLTLWRRNLVAIVRLLAIQGAAVAATALVVGIDNTNINEILLAVLAFALKAVVIPLLLLRIVRRGPDTRETEPLVNVSAALLITIGFAATSTVVSLASGPEARVVPFGFAIVLVGFFALTTRRKAISQLVGFLLFENGVALVAVLAAASVSFIIELGVALDVLLAVLVLQVLTARMHTKFGTLDLDHLQELRD